MRLACLLAAVGLLLPAPAAAAGATCQGHAPEEATCERTFVVENDNGVGLSVSLGGGILQGFQGLLRASVSTKSSSQTVTCARVGPGPGVFFCRGEFEFSPGSHAGETATLRVTVVGEGSWHVHAEG